jgi:hypothetical protein
LPVVLLAFPTLVRIFRRIFRFSIPLFLTSFIDTSLRRRFQPPNATATLRGQGIALGMTVLDGGPANGRYCSTPR